VSEQKHNTKDCSVNISTEILYSLGFALNGYSISIVQLNLPHNIEVVSKGIVKLKP